MTDDLSDPVIARRQCGKLVRGLRVALGLDQGDMDKEMLAEVKGYYATKLNKIESGTIAPGADDVAWFVRRFGPTSDEVAELERLAVIGRRRSRRTKTGKAAQQYISSERHARRICAVYNEIPGLVQLAEFAFEVLSVSPVVEPSRVRGLASERAERGLNVVRPGGPDISIVLGEDALYRWAGDPAVLRRELEHLLDISKLPNVRLKIALRTAGILAGLSCPFTLLYLDEDKTLAMTTSLSRPDYTKATAPYAAAFEQAWEVSSSEEESRTILEGRIADLNNG